ncbi:cytidylyltransferase domain-containing protein [Prochlorococcus sp. MIT 1223]|uniref:cytidylyltransferase domain-containing protein n=1 Tax=Prochlorococcus sp. MIT 1223 TaxID=3096217 RepID=UPI002A761529|nr:hypothetical protein [Prochlorococcus sp. MIT 1223]
MKDKVDLIIQARIGSKRLPGKSLFDLAGETLVGRILERVSRCKLLDDIVLAIPDTKENLPLVDIADKFQVKLYAGSENDLVERYYQAAKLENSTFICRLPADNATPEPSEIDRIIQYHLSLNNKGFSSNLSQINGSGYPDGIGTEIFHFDYLEQIREMDLDIIKREHLHLNFFDYKNQKAMDEEWCPINTIKCPIAFRRPDLVLDVNTYNDYLFMKELYEYLYPINPMFNIVDIINWYDNVYLNH